MKSVTSIIRHKWNLFKGIKFVFSEENKVPNSSLFNPYTKELVSNKPYLKKDELITKLSMAAVSFRKWKDVPLNNRVDLVKKFVNHIISDKEILKPLISQ